MLTRGGHATPDRVAIEVVLAAIIAEGQDDWGCAGCVPAANLASLVLKRLYERGLIIEQAMRRP